VKIPLTRAQFSVVDASDFEWLSQWKWHAKRSKKDNTYYAARKGPTVDGKQSQILMHRQIKGAEAGSRVDHKDGDGLNNSRANLRFTTSAQNQMNHRLRSDSSTGFMGVSFFPKTRRWRAYIQSRSKWKHLGYFSSPENAAIAFNVAALELHGEFARLNVSDMLLITEEDVCQHSQ
jgi:hypothetical protein